MQPALWIKAWMDTRWRFSIGAILFACTTVFIVMEWPTLKSLLPLASNLKVEGFDAREIEAKLQLSRTFGGYIYGNAFQGNLRWMGVVFALLLGIGSLSAPGGRFLLALPAKRTQWLLSRVFTGLLEIAELCLIPVILLPLLSPAVGESYGFVEGLRSGAALFVYLAVFLGLAALLSSIFEDIWKPLLIGIAVAVVLGMLEYVVPDSIYSVLSVETWSGWLIAALISVGLTYAAVQRLEHQDF